MSSSGSTTNYHKYGGKYGYYTQGALGTILAGARVYYPNARRWVQKDPILFDGGVNVFEYVKGNPVIYSDPTGRARCQHSITTGVFSCKPNEGGNSYSTEPGEGFSGQGECENNTACIDRKSHGPIPPGEYEIYKDTEKEGHWGLKPENHIPGISTIICKELGIGRCDFKLHPGSVSHGCITIRTDSAGNWPGSYEGINDLLNSENPKNTLTVVP